MSIESIIGELVASGGQLITVYGSSDDLVEVEGPCWDYGALRKSGEFEAFDPDNKEYMLVDQELEIQAFVLATYGEMGYWSFALSHPVGGIAEGIWAVSRPSQQVDYSMELCIRVPDGVFFCSREDRETIAAERAVERLGGDGR